MFFKENVQNLRPGYIGSEKAFPEWLHGKAAPSRQAGCRVGGASVLGNSRQDFGPLAGHAVMLFSLSTFPVAAHRAGTFIPQSLYWSCRDSVLRCIC